MLGVRDTTLAAAIGAMRSMYRAIVIRKSYESDDGDTGKLGFLQAYGRGDPDDSDNVELIQEEDLSHVQPYGLDSSPPADTETVVIEADGGEVAIGERYPVPKNLPSRASGDVMVYSLGEHYIHLDDDGDLIAEPKSGQYIKLGSGATEFVARADLVLQEIEDLVQEVKNAMLVFDTHTHAAGELLDSVSKPCTGKTATPSTSMVEPTEPSSVACDKVKVE